MKKLCAILSLFLTVLAADGQDEETFHTWTDFNYRDYSSAKFSFGGDAGIRGLLTSRNWTVLYVRPKVFYDFSTELTVAGAVGLFNTWNHDVPNSTELRLAPEVTFNWPSIKLGVFGHRGRYEERFIWNQNSGESGDISRKDRNSRFRYLLSFKTNYFNISESLTNFYVQPSAEFFLPFGTNSAEVFFNKNRLILGLGQLLKSGWSYKVDFMWQRSKNTIDGNFSTSDYVVRLRIYLKKLDYN